jgi:hypothetical protein
VSEFGARGARKKAQENVMGKQRLENNARENLVCMDGWYFTSECLDNV